MKMMILNILFILLTPSQAFSAEEKIRSYNTYEVKTQVEKNSYEAMVYEPKNKKIKAILIISPTISNVDSIEGANAQYFAKRGYLVLVPYPFMTELNSPNPDMDILDSDYYRPVVSAISFINLVDAKFKLPLNLPVFALGASQGGIMTVLIAAYIPRVKAAWIAVAGGDLPHIYAYSDVPAIVKFRIGHMKTLGISEALAYEIYLRSYLKNDPALSCKKIGIPLHQIIATRDTSVPTVTQEYLARECPAHSILRLKLSHSAGALTTVIMREKILDFFESTI
jgi:dienelactone hydrolase